MSRVAKWRPFLFNGAYLNSLFPLVFALCKAAVFAKWAIHGVARCGVNYFISRLKTSLPGALSARGFVSVKDAK